MVQRIFAAGNVFMEPVDTEGFMLCLAGSVSYIYIYLYIYIYEKFSTHTNLDAALSS